MPHFALTAVGADQPGIVASVTGALAERGCNLEDTSMSILRGHFAMLLVLSAPAGTTAADLEGGLAGPARAHELVIAVRQIDDDIPDSPAGAPWSVSVYGADRPGIVHRVASLLAEHHVNITDLATRVIGGPDRPVYAMLLEVTLPPEVDAAALSSAMDVLGVELGVECSMHPADADVL